MSETRWEVLDLKPGEIIRDWMEEDIRVLVMRGPSSLCAYVGIPLNHPLAGFDYDDVPLKCHGGLTFAAQGSVGGRDNWPDGWYWYGWDYGHCDDAATYYFEEPLANRYGDTWHGKKWTVAEVEEEAKWVAFDFKILGNLATEIYAKGLNASHIPNKEATA